MSAVPGIGSLHDASAALFVDGRLTAAIAEGRMSRMKCDGMWLPNFSIGSVGLVA
jgi:predicted NodU family carbamoyl transferase